MMRSRRMIIPLFGLATLTLAYQPAIAGLIFATYIQGQAVSVPFEPPLGQTLTYVMTQTPPDAAKKPVTARVEMRFEKYGTGYLLHTTTTPLGLPSDPGLPSFLSRPVVFVLDAEGALVGVKDEDAYWRDLESFLAKFGPKDADLRAAGLRTLAGIRSLPSEQRINLLGRNVVPVTSMTDLTMQVGQTFEDKDATVLPVAPNPSVGRITSQSLEAAASGKAHFRRVTTYDPVSFQKAVEAITALAKNSSAAKTAPDVESVESYDVDLKTGLVTAYEKRVGIRGKSETLKVMTTLVQIEVTR